MGQEKVNAVNEETIKAVGFLAGGIASSGHVCGCLIGAVALISSLYSRGNLHEKEDTRMWQLANQLARRFEKLTESHGGVNCRDIARVDWADKEAARDFYKNPESRRKYCIQLVGDTAYALGELLEQWDSG